MGAWLVASADMLSRSPSRWLYLAIFCTLVAIILIVGLWTHEKRGSRGLASANVVLIIVDTLRADHLGCYGYEPPTTASIDRIAQKGVVFEQAIANSSWTRPSIASLLTGTYPRTTAVYKEQYDALSPEVVTLAQMFKNRGWATYGVTGNPSINRVFDFHHGFDEYGDCGVIWPWMKGKRSSKFKKDVRLMEDADYTTDRTLELLERHKGGPFYLQVLYIDPHWPYKAPDRFEHELAGPCNTSTDCYDGEVAFADAELGRLVDRILDDHPNTLVIVTSDHGEGLADHPGVPRATTHGFTLYDSVLHVPLIFMHPELAAGTRFEDPVQLLDLVPTLADIFELPLDSQVEGTSLAPILRGEPAPPLADQIFSDTQFNEMDKISVRERNLKLIINRDNIALTEGTRPELAALAEGSRGNRSAMYAIKKCGPREMYRLPGSENHQRKGLNLADTDPDNTARLEQAIVDFESRILARPPINRDHHKEIDDSIIEQLKALGYLEE